MLHPFTRLRGSVRAKLTLWNTVTFAAVLACIGIAFRVLAQGYLLSGLDREMRAHAGHVPAASSQIMITTSMPTEAMGQAIGGNSWPDSATGTTDIKGLNLKMKVLEKKSIFVSATAPKSSRVEVVKMHDMLDGDSSGLFQSRTFSLDGTPKPSSLLSAFSNSVSMIHVEGSASGETLHAQAYRPWDSEGFAEASHGVETVRTVESEGERLRVLSRPLREGEQITGVRQVATSVTPMDRDLAGLTRSLFLLLPPALVIALFAGLFLTGKALSPVKALTHAAREIRPDQLTRRLPLNGTDEFDELAATFNSALGRVELAFNERERMVAQLQRFTGDASHELRTPLTTIKANTTVALADAVPSEEHVHALRKIDRAADRMTGLVEDLLLLARFDGLKAPLDARPISILLAAEEAIEMLPEAQPIIDVSGCSAEIRIAGEHGHIVRLLRNLLENARRFTPEDGQITVHALRLGSQVEIRVADTGSGVAPEHLPYLGERLFRIDSARNRSHGGAGLGLAICRSIAERHNGSLQVQSEPGKGTTVIVTLPAA